MKKALIFGITGQDGSYLAELLLKKNYLKLNRVPARTRWTDISRSKRSK